jgi:hypothetical protein
VRTGWEGYFRGHESQGRVKGLQGVAGVQELWLDRDLEFGVVHHPGAPGSWILTPDSSP